MPQESTHLLLEQERPDTSNHEVDESTLVYNLNNGNEAAFNMLFDIYHHAVYNYVVRFIKSPSLTDDIVQDVFVKIWEARYTIKSERSVRSFIFTIAKHHLLNVLKRASLEKKIKVEIMKFALQSHTRSEDEVIYADLTQFADRAIKNLPPQRRLIFKMHQEQGKDFKQIATILGISKNTVRDHLAKATKFIKSYLRVNAEITPLYAVIAFIC